MNQTMINAVELQMLQDELRHLREQNKMLSDLLTDARSRIKLLEAEVAWVENGYSARGER
jgi:hypothetical protein